MNALPQNVVPETLPGKRATMEDAVIEVLSAEMTFAGGTQVLSPIDLEIGKGELLTLIGPSGCGKSTLLSLMANLLEPTDGKLLWWHGRYPKKETDGKRLSVVFQDATLMPWARVEDNVRLPLDLAGVPKGEALERARAALARVGLAERCRYYPRQISGGMRMRAAIARALVAEPDVLLMDEPFGALDEFTRNRLDSDLLELRAERNLTVVFVTHSIYEAVFLSSRVVVMAANPGRIFAELAIDEPFPRNEDFRVSVRFADYCAQLTRLLGEAGRPDMETCA